MKKLLALILILPIFISAEDIEYPVELTCELGSQVIYFNLDGENNSMTFIQNPIMAEAKKYKLKRVSILEHALLIRINIRTNPHQYTINRFNLKINEFTRGTDGQCYKGYKEYKEKVI